MPGWIGAAMVISGALAYLGQQDLPEYEATKIEGDSPEIAFQKEMWNWMKDTMKPYQDLGIDALDEGAPEGMSPGDPSTTFTAAPVIPEFQFELNVDDEIYKFKQSQGEDSINRALAARGLSNSRAGVNALTNFNLDLASNETDSQFGRAKDIYGMNAARTMDNYQMLHGSELDQFNANNLLGNQKYQQWVDKVKIGMGSASTVGAGALQTGSGVANSMANQNSNLTTMLGLQNQSDIVGAQATADMGQIPFNAIQAWYYMNKPNTPGANNGAWPNTVP